MFEWLIQHFGLLGLFLVSTIANTILPIPFEPLLFLVNLTNYSIWIWLTVASLGAWVGESTVYWFTRGGKGPVRRATIWILDKLGMNKTSIRRITGKKENKWVREWFNEWGFGAIFVGAFTPLPMFLFDIFAGYLDYPYWKFTIACFIGKLARYLVILLGGIAIFKLIS